MNLTVYHSAQQAIRAVQHSLGTDSCMASENRFELMRATVWSIAAPGGKVHVNRAISTALPSWQLLSERVNASTETLRAELREALATLKDVGDLVELRGGYWAPASARLVELPDRIGYLLVGGVPSRLLRLDRSVIQFHGPHRHFATFPVELASVLTTVEDLKSWAKLPEVSLQDWAREVTESLVRTPYSPTTEDVFEFYLPSRSKLGAPQFFRWFENAGDIEGTLLARRRRLFGAREYRLVDVCSGRIVGTCELHDVDVRRLMYAFDLAAKNPVHARRVRVAMQTEWLFTSELPHAEQRTFAAFGILKIPDDRPFERRWTFVRNEELSLDILRSLGIVLGQQPRKDRR